MLDAALRLRALGYSVIPVKGKLPLLAWQEFQSRHATPDEIRQWFTQWTDAGVGVVTGAISNLVVLDIDVKGTGEMITDPVGWVYDHGLTPTMTVRTASGGLHLYYAHPGVRTPNAARCAVIGGLPVDVRGDGGFVVSPPSEGYRLLPHWHGTVPWPGVPGDTRNKAGDRAGIDAITAGTADDLFAPAPEGQRNQAAAKLAGYLLKVSDEQAAWVQLRQWNSHNLPPLDETELQRTFLSIARREASKPVSILNSRIPNTDDVDWLEGAAWADAVANEPERNGIRLGTIPLCSEHKGFCPGDLIAIAARPGTGKTTLLANAFWELGVDLRHSGAFFSGDMSAAEILQWMTMGRVGKERYTPADWQESLQLLGESPLAIACSGRIVLSRLEHLLMRRPGTRFVVVDHFNKLKTESSTRATDLKSAAADIKQMAKHYGVTFLVLSQLTRASSSKEYLTEDDLAESDALIQESDVVYGMTFVGDKAQQDPLRATLRVQLLKNRFGPPFVEQICWFHRHCKQFEWLNRDVNWSNVR